MFAQSVFAPFTKIEPLLTIHQFAHRKMQVANSTARRVWLAGYLTILLKEIVQRKDHLLEIERAAVAALHARRAERWKHASDIISTKFTTTCERIGITIARCTVARTRCMVIAQSTKLHTTRIGNIPFSLYPLSRFLVQSRVMLKQYPSWLTINHILATDLRCV